MRVIRITNRVVTVGDIDRRVIDDCLWECGSNLLYSNVFVDGVRIFYCSEFCTDKDDETILLVNADLSSDLTDEMIEKYTRLSEDISRKYSIFADIHDRSVCHAVIRNSDNCEIIHDYLKDNTLCRIVTIEENGMCEINTETGDQEAIIVCRLDIDYWKSKMETSYEMFDNGMFWKDDHLFTDLTDSDIQYINNNASNIWKKFE